MTNKITVSDASSTSGAITYFDKSIGSSPKSRAQDTAKKSRAIERAVYGHIRALRALGRDTVTTVEISRALGLPHSDIEAAIAALKNKGVKEVAE